MDVLEHEISIGGKQLSLLRFILFVGSGVGLFLSLVFQFLRLFQLSNGTSEMIRIYSSGADFAGRG